MVNSEEDLLGNYHWELVEVDDEDLFSFTSLGQQGKIIRTIQDIINPSYINGTYYINEQNLPSYVDTVKRSSQCVLYYNEDSSRYYLGVILTNYNHDTLPINISYNDRNINSSVNVSDSKLEHIKAAIFGIPTTNNGVTVEISEESEIIDYIKYSSFSNNITLTNDDAITYTEWRTLLGYD